MGSRIVLAGLTLATCAMAAGLVAGLYLLAVDDGVLPAIGTPEPVAMRIVDALRQHPDDWRGDDIVISDGRVCVWIANAVYGLGVATGTRCWPRDGALSRASRSAILWAARETVIPRLRQEKLAAIAAAMGN